MPPPPSSHRPDVPPPRWRQRWRLSQRYQFGHDRSYVFCKLALDPVYDAVVNTLHTAPPLPLLDIGCGPGLLAAVLRSHGFSPPIHGLDYDPRKTATAQAALADLPDCTFTPADARAGLPPHLGHITILDILQFFSPEETTRLLTAAADRLAPGGRLIIRSCLRTDSWKFHLTRAGDWIAQATTWMKAPATSYPSPSEITHTLTAAGLTGSIQPLTGPLPFNNFLLVFQRTPEEPVALVT